MTGFSSSSWGGFLKQAMSTVENRLDKVLDISGDTTGNMETFIDPITGIVTTIPRQPTPGPAPAPTMSTGLGISTPDATPPIAMPTPNTPAIVPTTRSMSTTPPTSTAWRTQKENNMKRSTSDLSSRLQAIVQDKARSAATSPSPSVSSSVMGKVGEEKEEGEGKEETAKEDGGLKEAEKEVENGKEESKNIEIIQAGTVEGEGGEKEVEIVKMEGLVVQETLVTVVQEEVKVESEISSPKVQNEETETIFKEKQQVETIQLVETVSTESAIVSPLSTSTPADSPIVISPDPSTPVLTHLDLIPDPADSAAHLRLIISQRERQLMSAMEANAELNTSVQQLREADSQKQREIEHMGAKVAELEKQVTAAVEAARLAREKASQQQGHAQSQKEAGAAAVTAGLQKVVEEQKAAIAAKDEQIAGLLAEGEKLSKNELKHMTTIKKLRSEKTEAEKTITEMQKKVEKASGDQVETNGKLARMMETERKMNGGLRRMESIKTLTETSERQAKQIIKLESDLVSSKEAQANLQLALDRAWQELAEARKFSAEASAQAQSAALDKEIKANERLHKELQQARQEAEETETSLRKEVSDGYPGPPAHALADRGDGWVQGGHVTARYLGTVESFLNLTSFYSRCRKLTEWRPTSQALQMRLQASEARSEDLSAGMHDSTRPLLKQIEALQTQHSVAMKNWDKIEKSLTVRLNEMEAERPMAMERERGLSARTTRITTLEAQLSTERHEKARLIAELETERLRSADYEVRSTQATAKLDALRSTQSRALDEAKEHYQRLLRQQLQEEREQWEQKHRQDEERERETERRKTKTEHVRKTLAQSGRQGSFASVEGESALGMSVAFGGGEGGVQGQAMLSPTFSRSFDVSGSCVITLYVAGGFDLVLQSPSSSSRSSFDSTYQMVSSNGNSFPPNVVIDRLNLSVRQLEGQVGFLQTQLQSTSQARGVRTSGRAREGDDSIGRPVSIPTLLHRDLYYAGVAVRLKSDAAHVARLETEQEELNKRYHAALEMLGERTEEVQELKADIADVKEMYRNQIVEMVAKIDQAAAAEAK
ncbi:hypothetical protein BC936DRAFT_137512 [Jimgerdemannia flammicorona]|uniref:TATA element modulatory factor 1 TATA binding domain-containing protein n=1 Tax=Jimgerdemannia flammicorona TaxID=994334 RepID=A0A433DJ34_9FUNG|nr:hypothetical protein BC936DRAFT_137512 [Jimgerdemannia flammicorona]